MSRAFRFLSALILALACLSLAGYFALTHITSRWFERDVELRSQLAAFSSRQNLEREWDQPTRLLAALSEITRDERIMGAAACSADGAMVASTEFYPPRFACRGLLHEMRVEATPGAASWSTNADLPEGRVHLTATRVGSGYAILVHDLSFVGRREETAREVLFAAFFILAAVASIVTLLAVQFAWRTWTLELTRALSGGGTKDFSPLLRDVRALAERLANEHEREARGGLWSPERLRATLSQHLQGERIVILANREPYVHQKGPDGVTVLHPASGLVTALEPVMRACSGVWVAHGSGSADRETVDAHDRVLVPPGEESYQLRRVWLSEAEEDGYYYGFSNEGLWPLCHVAHTRPTFRTEDWEHYVRVNQRFADAVCEEVDTDDPIVLVQDYHFALAPKMIRERLPRATIITFWHIPWPNAERLGICPWREEIISGLLGSSIIGFHTQQHCNNFIDSVDSYVESRIDREHSAVVQGARRTLVRPYPISIEWPVHWLSKVPATPECRAIVRKELNLAEDALIGIGVDRLDYTKGIEERLSAVDELLTREPAFRGRFTFIQLAAPSRTKIPRYQELSARVEKLVEEINAKWSSGSYRPIVLHRSHYEPIDVFRYYRAADVCYVSSLHDGMNLVAKEFVAAREDLAGVLVLSEFTGASRDLTEALIVNPYDLRQASAALAMALRMPVDEQRERMLSMRRMVSEFNVYRWAGRMLVDASELRRKERMTGRLGSVSTRGELA